MYHEAGPLLPRQLGDLIRDFRVALRIADDGESVRCLCVARRLESLYVTLNRRAVIIRGTDSVEILRVGLELCNGDFVNPIRRVHGDLL